MSKSILPLIAVVGAGFFLLNKTASAPLNWGSGRVTAEKTAKGIFRKIVHVATHGDLLESAHEFKPAQPGDTLKITGVPSGWTHWGEMRGTPESHGPEEERRLDIYHDKENQTLYATAIKPGHQFGVLSEWGIDNSSFVVALPPGASADEWRSTKYIAIFSGPE